MMQAKDLRPGMWIHGRLITEVHVHNAVADDKATESNRTIYRIVTDPPRDDGRDSYMPETLMTGGTWDSMCPHFSGLYDVTLRSINAKRQRFGMPTWDSVSEV